MRNVPESGNCYRCSMELDQDFYCSGCEEFICEEEECGGAIAWSVASAMGHGHHPEDHFIDADADDEVEAWESRAAS